MKVTLLAVTPEPVKTIEKAGRTCYRSEEKITDESAAKFVRAIRKSGHHSVLEHASATFVIEGGSRAMTHQLVRHRLMAISQESQRYCDEAGIYDKEYYVIPKSVQEAGHAMTYELDTLEERTELEEHSLIQWYEMQIEKIDMAYRKLQRMLREAKEKGLTKGKVNEDARFLLPNACMSKIVITANFRELRHIFKVRCEKHAQWEIRKMALKMLRIMQGIALPVFEDFKIEKLSDNTEQAITEERG